VTTKDFSEPTQNACVEHDAAESLHVHEAQVNDQSQKTTWTWCVMVLSPYDRVTKHCWVYPTLPDANKHIWQEKWEIWRTHFQSRPTQSVSLSLCSGETWWMA